MTNPKPTENRIVVILTRLMILGLFAHFVVIPMINITNAAYANARQKAARLVNEGIVTPSPALSSSHMPTPTNTPSPELTGEIKKPASASAPTTKSMKPMSTSFPTTKSISKAQTKGLTDSKSELESLERKLNMLLWNKCFDDAVSRLLEKPVPSSLFSIDENGRPIPPTMSLDQLKEHDNKEINSAKDKCDKLYQQ